MDTPSLKKTRSRVITVFVLLSLISAGILLRASSIQLIENPKLTRIAKRQFHSKFWIQPRRGSIFDRNGEPLAFNVETKSLAVDCKSIKKKSALARKLSRALKTSEIGLKKRISQNKNFVWIKRHLDDVEIRALIKEKIIVEDGPNAEGIILVRESGRRYPSKNLASQVIGKVNIDSEGVEGIEYKFNSHLSGQGVSIRAIRDAKGRPTFFDPEAAQSIKDGKNITLTIDAPLQHAVEESLQDAVHRYQAKAASAIVLNAETGEILAMASMPLNTRNTLVTDGYEPGSTLKPLLLASALKKGHTPNTKIWGEKGSFVIQGRRISEAEAHEKFEWMSLSEMIQKSSNVVSAKLALKLGSDHYLETLKQFRLGQTSGIDFPGEISGRLPNSKNISQITLANIGFGHGLLTTPLQMTLAYAAIANGGKIVNPKLLLDSNLTPAVSKQILNPQQAKQITAALLKVTQEGGTGTQARLDGFEVAGKTGTAQKIDPKTRSYSRSKYVSSFIGFPVGIEPKIVIFASVDEPKKGYYASVTAAPLFREILNMTVNRMSIPSTIAITNKIANQPAPIEESKSDVIQITQSSVSNSDDALDTELTWKMPNLIGHSLRESLETLEGRPFKIETQGSGFVDKQIPPPGAQLKENDLIHLKLSERSD